MLQACLPALGLSSGLGERRGLAVSSAWPAQKAEESHEAASTFLLVLLASDSLTEWSKAVAPGAIPKGRGLEPHSCHLLYFS